MYGVSTKGNFQMSVSVQGGNSPVTATVSIGTYGGWKGSVNMEYSADKGIGASPTSETVSVPDQGSINRYITLTGSANGVTLTAKGTNANDSTDYCTCQVSGITIL